MDDFLIGIGQRVRTIRKKNNMTIHTLATNAGVSNGLISRIENGRTIPSLPVLLQLISALEIDPSNFFEGVEQKAGAKFIHIKKKDQVLIEKEIEAEGFQYFHVFNKSVNTAGFDAAILIVSPNSKRDKVITDAWEFKYVLKGSCTYNIDNEEVEIKKGDSIYFNGRLPHVPINRKKKECIMLVLYLFSDTN